jgi:hypothetical protein
MYHAVLLAASWLLLVLTSSAMHCKYLDFVVTVYRALSDAMFLTALMLAMLSHSASMPLLVLLTERTPTAWLFSMRNNPQQYASLYSKAALRHPCELLL